MSEIAVVVERTYDAPPAETFSALADYVGVRPKLLPPEITDFAVLDGGTGTGTRFSYHLHATRKRVRQVEADVTEPGRQLLETDGNSSLEVFWNVAEAAGGRSRVTARVSWDGATGVGGFFERRFAPKGIERIYASELDRLERALAGS
jgi:uncharacterized protein YndB with AHSA1/START domain